MSTKLDEYHRGALSERLRICALLDKEVADHRVIIIMAGEDGGEEVEYASSVFELLDRLRAAIWNQVPTPSDKQAVVPDEFVPF